MTTAEDLLQYILPGLAVSIAVVLLCFYHYSKKRKGSYDVTVPPSRVHTAQPEDGTEMVVFIHSVPSGYSITDPPPPYSLFDPKLTVVWSGAEPPPYEMYTLNAWMEPPVWTQPVFHTHRDT